MDSFHESNAADQNVQRNRVLDFRRLGLSVELGHGLQFVSVIACKSLNIDWKIRIGPVHSDRVQSIMASCYPL